MKKTDCAYFAGIFDGEGTVTLNPSPESRSRKRLTYFLRVNLASTNEWIIQQLRFTFGGQIYFEKRENDKWKNVWHWTATRNIAYNFLVIILPYLHLKRPHAELALQFQRHKKKGGYKSHEYLDMESDFKQTILELNRTGKNLTQKQPLKMESQPSK